MVVRRTSIRSQLFWSVAGIVLLTIVLCAGAVYRLVVIPVEDELAAHDMRMASMRAADQIRSLVRAVENITRNGRAWGSEGLLAIDDPDELTRMMIPVLTHRPEVTAVLCANDEMAAGLLRALHEHGRRVPEDVSVVGFDDIPLAEYLWPPLTTVRQDFRAIGSELVALLLQQIRERTSLAGHHVVVPTQLIVRASTGPAPLG